MVQQKALLLEEKQGPLVVGTRDIPKAGPGNLVVKNEAVALNPVDWKIQKVGFFIDKYPTVLGTDAAGIVAEVGEGVTNVVKGDRVLYQGVYGNIDKANFQQYSLIQAELTAKVPTNISFDEAASIPVGLATAAIGLFSKHGARGAAAGLYPPWEAGGRGKYAGKPILVFGGASSVGQYVIQLAKISGFSPIIATASPHNGPLLKSLGATHVIDRNLPVSALESSVTSLLTSSPLEIVYDAVSHSDTQQAGYDLLAPGGSIVLVLNPSIKVDEKSGKQIVHVYGSVHDATDVGKSLFSELTGWLEAGDIKPNRVEVLPGGLAGIVDGLKALENNAVSAHKLVARPQETV